MNKNKRLTLEQRKTIEDLLHKNFKHKEICEKIGIAESTLYRDLKKCKDSYSAEEAHNNTCRGFHPVDWNIIGKRFGLLVVLQYANKYKHRTWWKCQCDCGQTCVVSRKMLADYCSVRRPLSCGCIAKQQKGSGEKVSMQEAVLRKFQDLIAFRKINKNCWEWQGYTCKGVCRCTWKNKGMSVRKCMYLLINDTTFEPNHVYATCGNRLCFNPDHIALGRPEKRNHYYN